MNASIENAQEKTGTVTAKTLRDALKGRVENVYMHGRAVFDRPSYSDAFIFDLSIVRGSRAAGTETIQNIEIPGSVRGGSTSQRETVASSFGLPWMRYCEAYRPTKGFWSLGFGSLLGNVLDLLPADAQVAFEVCLDAGTNEYLVRSEAYMGSFRESGLHCDHLYLVATFKKRGKDQRTRFLLDTSTGAHNSARFGNPGSSF